MLFETLKQSYVFLGAMYFGILLGVCFEILNFCAKILKKTKLVLFLRDLIFSLIATFLFIICTNVVNYGEFRLYIFLAFIVGFILEKISIGYLVAFLIEKLYNFLKFIYKKITKLKFFKRCMSNDETKSQNNLQTN